MQSHFRLKLLVSAIALAAATSAGAAPVNNAFVPLTIAQHATILHNGEVVTGPVASSQPMHISVSLKLQNQDKLNAFLATASKPGTPVANRSMSSADFIAQYSPTQAQAQAVATYLNSAGFSHVTIAPNRQLVTATATADTVRAAFNTTFESVRTTDGRVAFHNTGDVMVPASLKDSVLSVVGLDTVHISHSFAQKKLASSVTPPLGAGNTFVTTAPVGHDPADFATIYGANTLKTASTVNVGIITEGSMTNIVSDLLLYTKAHNLPPVNTTTVVVDGGSTDISGDVEWDLDSQDITGMTGGVKEMVFYATTGLTDSAITDDYNQAVVDDHVALINVSLGECETDTQTSGTAVAEDQIFQQAIAQGQTFSVSAGDDGANECGLPETQSLAQPGKIPSWPASSQFVVSVGGTEVYTTGNTTWLSEITWNNKSEYEGATGGSPSSFEAMPSWQSGVGTNTGSVMRGVPDVAFAGSPDSGAIIYSDGASGEQVGGTSLSSPLFVGAWARTIANTVSVPVTAEGATPSTAPLTLGFAAPLIYKLPTSAFQDVTVGDNEGEKAAPGWDYTTGFGSPIVSAMVANVVAPAGGTPVAKFTTSTGAAVAVIGGKKVTFTDASTDAGGRLSYSWNFGDSTASDEVNPVHTFPGTGKYVVTETVTDVASKTTASYAVTLTITSTVDTVEALSPVPVPAAPAVPALPI